MSTTVTKETVDDVECVVCPICQEGDGADGVGAWKMLPCKHSFHGSCIDTWTGGGNNNCPMCRARIQPRRPRRVATERETNNSAEVLAAFVEQLTHTNNIVEGVEQGLYDVNMPTRLLLGGRPLNARCATCGMRAPRTRCARCHCIYYCNEQCYAMGFEEHRYVCPAMRHALAHGAIRPTDTLTDQRMQTPPGARTPATEAPCP